MGIVLHLLHSLKQIFKIAIFIDNNYLGQLLFVYGRFNFILYLKAYLFGGGVKRRMRIDYVLRDGKSTFVWDNEYDVHSFSCVKMSGEAKALPQIFAAFAGEF